MPIVSITQPLSGSIMYLAGQRMMLAEVEAVANQLGPLSSQRLRTWVATRREQLKAARPS